MKCCSKKEESVERRTSLSHGLVAVWAFQVLHQVQVIISEGAFDEASIKISAL